MPQNIRTNQDIRMIFINEKYSISDHLIGRVYFWIMMIYNFHVAYNHSNNDSNKRYKIRME